MLRFACPHCQQKLSVGVHKAGTAAQCPRCKKTISIPVPGPNTPHLPASPPPAAPAGSPEARPAAFDQYLVYDDETEVVYDTADPTAASAALANQMRISIPRWVLYAQGGLLAAVALFSFSLGIMAGGGRERGADPARPQSCKLFGEVSFLLAGRKTGDDGAVIIALPQKEIPDEKAPAAGLAPADPPPANGHHGLEIIRVIGGGYARTNKEGKYELTLPKTGPYYVLVISNNVTRKSGNDMKAKEAGEMGRFLEGPVDLVGRKNYQWTAENLRSDQRLNVFFE